jgi:hypothetical protein
MIRVQSPKLSVFLLIDGREPNQSSQVSESTTMSSDARQGDLSVTYEADRIDECHSEAIKLKSNTEFLSTGLGLT